MDLRHAFDTPATKRQYVRQLFSTIANRYDIATVILSYGCDRRWKRLLANDAIGALGARSGSGASVRALDLACGTGDIAAELSTRGAAVVGLDVTPRMVEIARDKVGRKADTCLFLVGDMMALPFPDDHFDLVTVGYGLRNVPLLDGAVREIHRVLRSGGSVLSLDFNRPRNAVVRSAYLAYLTVVGSLLGTVLHGDPDTYRYIPASLRRYPGASGVAALMRELTFSDVGYTSLLGGLMAINHGRK